MIYRNTHILEISVYRVRPTSICFGSSSYPIDAIELNAFMSRYYDLFIITCFIHAINMMII